MVTLKEFCILIISGMSLICANTIKPTNYNIGVAGSIQTINKEIESTLQICFEPLWKPNMLFHVETMGKMELSTYWALKTVAGPGIYLKTNRIFVPFWVGGGFTTSAIWDKSDFVPCLAFGSGLRIFVNKQTLFGFNYTLHFDEYVPVTNNFNFGLSILLRE